MKKIISLALVMALMLAMGTMAFAEKTTTLTTTVPDAEYTLNIPANQTVPFGAQSTEIGNVTVSDSSGFAVGKNIQVIVSYGDFTSSEVSTTIPFTIRATYYYDGASTGNETKAATISSGSVLTFPGYSSGSTSTTAVYPDITSYKMTKMSVNIEDAAWGKALGGEYTATVTFTAEIVAE